MDAMIAEISIPRVWTAVEAEPKRRSRAEELAEAAGLRDELVVSAAREIGEAVERIRRLNAEVKVLMNHTDLPA